MASSISLYTHAWKLLMGPVDVLSSTLSVRLVTSGYVFNAAHTQWDNGANDATDPSYNEVAAGSGYSTGGATLSGKATTNSVFSASDVTWSSLTKTFRGALIVANGTFGGVVNPVLAYILFDTTPANIVSTGSDFTVAWHDTDGIFYLPS